jgi:hypothetical protein
VLDDEQTSTAPVIVALKVEAALAGDQVHKRHATSAHEDVVAKVNVGRRAIEAHGFRSRASLWAHIDCVVVDFGISYAIGTIPVPEMDGAI